MYNHRSIQSSVTQKTCSWLNIHLCKHKRKSHHCLVTYAEAIYGVNYRQIILQLSSIPVTDQVTCCQCTHPHPCIWKQDKWWGSSIDKSRKHFVYGARPAFPLPSFRKGSLNVFLNSLAKQWKSGRCFKRSHCQSGELSYGLFLLKCLFIRNTYRNTEKKKNISQNRADILCLSLRAVPSHTWPLPFRH